MIVRKEYEFPIPGKDDVKSVETKVLQLQRRIRNGDKLDGVEEDYLDYANNVLDTLS